MNRLGFPFPSVSIAVAFWLRTMGAGLVGVPCPLAVSASPRSLLEVKARVSPVGRVDWENLPAKSYE